ncbi:MULTISPECIES: methylenetetrahydrofolate reductase [unclassified Actinopolyspora]|uniref:methylenetetrahydrofolate reductase n=1 Tax=unclassified Actinopolyspora TaxID=2639451 RepID=UPI0013F67C42|nr:MULTISPECIES: methylenetetrahydrofolate reductase [unclassified Actinopolyspora]NHD17005.1 5,10-methylenetetrahydrofolate reductase [Actinopolyspora sp. BKK2]NHE76157.1 5,10-methylenetetrahydrofolate reductase [Actinopolyspora sp. BKK1]
MSTNARQQLQHHLRNARYEVLPLRGTLEQVQGLPPGTTVTVTSSPSKGTEATLDLAARLRGSGMHVVPHLAARLVRDNAHLDELLSRIEALGLTEVFVIAGDADNPAGRFTDALSLLRGMEEIGNRPHRVGITGYPEPHSFISDQMTIQATDEKARYADYIVSQICYDPNTIASWVKTMRARGVTLPVYIGAPGSIDPSKLLRISMKIGLGQSMRFLRKQHGVVGKLLTRYTPENLFDELSPYLVDPDYNIAGCHLFTFNEIAKTRQWAMETADRLQEVPA